MSSSEEKKSPANAKKESTEASDFDYMDQFCADVPLDEISFSDWKVVHSCLDLVVAVKITCEESKTGICKRITWTRTSTKNGKKSKSKVVREVDIPPQTENRAEITLNGLGDTNESETGNVTI